VDPLVGRLADARHLLLYRSVFASGRATRQGLVLDVDGLGASLRARTLGAGALPGATLGFGDAELDAPAARYRYRHRFAEPFDALTARLALAPLDGGRGTGVIWALAGLLLATGAAGLLAVDRMVSVAMAFAERRSNFVAAVTHELKTPLTAIRMYGEMLRDDLVPGEEKRREYYRSITAESERLSRLIDNVLRSDPSWRRSRRCSGRTRSGRASPCVSRSSRTCRPCGSSGTRCSRCS
jgi:signal transduction histidine kinase